MWISILKSLIQLWTGLIHYCITKYTYVLFDWLLFPDSTNCLTSDAAKNKKIAFGDHKTIFIYIGEIVDCVPKTTWASTLILPVNVCYDSEECNDLVQLRIKVFVNLQEKYWN